MARTRKSASSSDATLSRAASSVLAARPDCAGVRSSWLMLSSRLRSACSLSIWYCMDAQATHHDAPSMQPEVCTQVNAPLGSRRRRVMATGMAAPPDAAVRASASANTACTVGRSSTCM
jgi:hypothetical protein